MPNQAVLALSVAAAGVMTLTALPLEGTPSSGSVTLRGTTSISRPSFVWMVAPCRAQYLSKHSDILHIHSLLSGQ